MAPSYKTGGDDLDDGLELDPDLLASDDEGVDGDDGDFLSADDEPAPAAPSRKRKASGDAAAAAVQDEQGDVAMLPADGDAKKRRREKDKARRAAKRAAAAGDEGPIADPTQLAPGELAALLLTSARATFPNSSPMEIDEVVLGEDRLLAPLPAPSGDGFEPLVARLDDLLKDAPKKPAPGTPRALIVSLSGIRCADVVRAVRDVKRPGGEVAKLFAKHFKLVDQVKYLARTRVAIAVGTPARVAKLLADGALKVKQETVVLFDIGHRDSKNRTLLSLPEARDELWKSLLSGDARAALTRARVKYAAF
ncbi:Protein cms1 [Vanrija albida]|uniref:Protein cms1 n=1 Tax=Vanrija albida TaxID=181172 RepID=A0ABR3Q7Y4_9TREE